MERSQLYGLLATAFRREPSAEFLCHLKTPELIASFVGAGINLGDEFKNEKPAHLADSLAVEYTRLFLGPGHHIAPYESVQLKRGSGILWGVETSAVRRIYRDAGFEMAETETEIPDHLCVELDFLSLLAKQEAWAWTDQDSERTTKLLQFQHSFISKHLGKWVSVFCNKVKDKAEFDFYPAFAELLRGFLFGEKAEIVDRLSLINVNGKPMRGESNGKVTVMA